MTTVWPTDYDSFARPTPTTIDTAARGISLSDLLNRHSTAIEQIEQQLGKTGTPGPLFSGSFVVAQGVVSGGAAGAANTEILGNYLASYDTVVLPPAAGGASSVVGLAAPITLGVQGQSIVSLNPLMTFGANSHVNGIALRPATDGWTPDPTNDGVVIMSGGHNSVKGVNISCASSGAFTKYGIVAASTAPRVSETYVDGGVFSASMGFTNGSTAVTYAQAAVADVGKSVAVTTGLGVYTIASVTPGTGYTLSAAFTGATGAHTAVVRAATWCWFDNGSATSARWNNCMFDNPGGGAMYLNSTDAVGVEIERFGTTMLDTGSGNYNFVGGHWTSSDVAGPSLQVNANGTITSVLFDSIYQQASGGAAALIIANGSNANSVAKFADCWFYNNSGAQSIDLVLNSGATPVKIAGGSAHGASGNSFKGILNTGLLIDRVDSLDVNGGNFAANTIAAYFPNAIPSAYEIDVRGAGAAFNGRHTHLTDAGSLLFLAADTAVGTTNTVLITSPVLPVGTYDITCTVELTSTAAANVLAFLDAGTATAGTGRNGADVAVTTTGPASVTIACQPVVTVAGTLVLTARASAAGPSAQGGTGATNYTVTGSGASGGPTSMRITRIA